MFNIFLFKFVLYSLYAHLLLYKAYRHSEGVLYYQRRLSFWAIVVGYIGGIPVWFLWYNMIGGQILYNSIIIGICSFVLSFIGIEIGKKLCKLNLKYLDIIGGIVLILFGVKVLMNQIHIF